MGGLGASLLGASLLRWRPPDGVPQPLVGTVAVDGDDTFALQRADRAPKAHHLCLGRLVAEDGERQPRIGQGPALQGCQHGALYPTKTPAHSTPHSLSVPSTSTLTERLTGGATGLLRPGVGHDDEPDGRETLHGGVVLLVPPA
jgi:hypothetical protein